MIKRIPRRKVYEALFEYCAFESEYKDNRFYLASIYDDVIDFVHWISEHVGSDDDTKTYRAIQRAKTCLLKNRWLYKYTTSAHKYYIGEPAYIVNYIFNESDLKNYKKAKEESRIREFIDEIPIK